jgi:type IV secretory pathway VirB3-like protein
MPRWVGIPVTTNNNVIITVVLPLLLIITYLFYDEDIDYFSLTITSWARHDCVSWARLCF